MNCGDQMQTTSETKYTSCELALQRIQYRMLYFFYEKQYVITHGIIKEGKEVPPKEISLAVTRKAKFEDNPMKHTVRG